MPFTNFSNLDFEEIKQSIRDYLRVNSNFTDFDFEGSNFSILIDVLAYNTYITAFNANLAANEAFLDSAVIRENVVSLARTIGYVPRSAIAAEARVSFSVTVSDPTPTLTLKAGLVAVSSVNGSRYIFSIPNDISVSVVNGVATFDQINIYQGTLINQSFTVSGSIDQRFILDNEKIDTSTLNVYVKGVSETGIGRRYSQIDNIINIDSQSETYLIQEVLDERYELLFGDGVIGKKLENDSVITATYIITDGLLGNDATNFVYQGTLVNAYGSLVLPTSSISITTNNSAKNGDDIEPVSSIKYFAPRLYSSQYRAVTTRDYEAIIANQVFPNTESVSVIGGEELDPPQFGNVLISIKPRNGIFISEFDKEQILAKLKQYTMAGINVSIVDLKLLYVELESYVYYDANQVPNIDSLKSEVINNLTRYSNSLDINKFGGRLKYSKVLSVIDNTNRAITSNITRVIMRRNISALLDQFSQYEICFGNRFHVNKGGYNIKSTGFTVRIQETGGGTRETETCYFTDVPNEDMKTGIISIVKPSLIANEAPVVVVPSAGTINYEKGKIILNTVFFASTILPNDIIEIQAIPESNDVLALKDLFLVFDVSKSKINMIKDVIESGDDSSGIKFFTDSFRSSYSNGSLERT